MRRVRFKLESYADLLVEERSRLERGLAEAARRLRKKVEAIALSPEATAAS